MRKLILTIHLTICMFLTSYLSGEEVPTLKKPYEEKVLTGKELSAENIPVTGKTESIFIQPKKGCKAIGLIYPGISYRYWWANKKSMEIRFQSSYQVGTDEPEDVFNHNIKIFGVRAYYEFKDMLKAGIYTGIEIDYIQFEGNSGISTGNGYACEIFIGLDYWKLKYDSSFALDIGVAYMHLEDKKHSSNELIDGFEIVLNIGINFYPKKNYLFKEK